MSFPSEISSYATRAQRSSFGRSRICGRRGTVSSSRRSSSAESASTTQDRRHPLEALFRPSGRCLGLRGRYRRIRDTGDERAVHPACTDIGDCLAERLIRGLVRTVTPEEARLPSRKPVLIEELEVEERGDERLAVREQEGVPELARLVADPWLRRRGRERRNDERVGLLTRVETSLGLRHRRLEPGLEVPDRRPTSTRDRLRCSLERECERAQESRQITLAHGLRIAVRHPWWLGRVVRIRVVPERVDDRMSSLRSPVRVPDPAD